MKVSVIIVNYRSAADLANCVRTLREYSWSDEYELVVVDNNSGDEEQALLKRIQEIDQLIFLNGNYGFGTANNRAAERALGEYLFFLNPDCLVKNDAIAEFLQRSGLFGSSTRQNTAGQKPAAVLGAYQVDGDGGKNHAWGSFASHTPRGFLRNEFREAFKPLIRKMRTLKPGFRRPDYSGLPEQDQSFENETVLPVDWVNGAAMFMRADLFRSIGGFDENLFLFSEEVDLQKRLADAGYQSFVTPGPHIAHLHEKGRQMKANTRVIFYHSFLYYLAKHYSGPRFAFTRMAYFGICLLTLILSIAGYPYKTGHYLNMIIMVYRFRPKFKTA